MTVTIYEELPAAKNAIFQRTSVAERWMGETSSISARNYLALRFVCRKLRHLLSILFFDAKQSKNSEHGVYSRLWMGIRRLGSACLRELTIGDPSNYLITE